jgi:hypothetical protein
MSQSLTFRRFSITVLIVTTALWAEAGLALVVGDQVLQCSMSAHEMAAMGGMPCCPMDESQSPSTSHERPSCCSMSSVPERPLTFVVTSKQLNFESLALAALPATVVTSAAASPQTRQHVDTLPFLKPVLELKTDLRI